MRTAQEHWLPLWQRFGFTGDGVEWHHKLIDDYSESQRAYHTLQHLNECLMRFDDAKAGGGMTRPDLIEMAMWFHDAVYDSKSSQNEALSAQMAVDALGETDAAREVARLIMLTKSHKPGEGPDDAWIIDIDLGIFAQSAERVAEYERQIRAEYTWVPEAVYREKRAEALEAFLKRERIYQTEFFHQRDEATARCHLALLIEQLSA